MFKSLENSHAMSVDITNWKHLSQRQFGIWKNKKTLISEIDFFTISQWGIFSQHLGIKDTFSLWVWDANSAPN